MSARVAVVLVTHDTCGEVLGALATLPPSPGRELVVVDTGSRDGTAAAVRAAREDVRVLELVNTGFGRAANAGIRLTHAPVVVVANADVRFEVGAVAELAAALERDGGLGAVGPQVRYPDGTLQASARNVPGTGQALAHALLGRMMPDNPWTRRYHGRDADPGLPREAGWLSGCAVALRRSAVEELGGFDPGFFLYVEDLDLALRMRAAGWRLAYEPRARVRHAVGASTRHRRGPALVAHARSIDRHVARRVRGRPVAGLRWLLWPLLGGWAAMAWVVERILGRRRSTTGERRAAGESV